MTSKQTGDIYYEWAHKHCHPETCSCRENYRIVEFPYTIDWAETEQDAKELVRKYVEAERRAESSATIPTSTVYSR